MPRNLLVTGGAGFIGANFVRFWLREHPSDRVVVLDALTYAGNRSSLEAAESNPSYRFVLGDIRDLELVESTLRAEQIDTIVHLAAESHVDRSIAGPDPFLDVNVIGTHVLLKAARTVWLEKECLSPIRHRFHHVSTDEVYGSLGPEDPAFTEATAYAPNSPYAASKAASDHLVRAYHHTYGLETTISNCSNNYGPYQFPEKLLPLCILNLLRDRPLPIYGDGSNVRDWLWVEDHCRGIEAILERGRPGRTYNIGGGAELRNLDLVRTLCGLLEKLFAESEEFAARFPEATSVRNGTAANLIQFVEDRPGHDRRYAIDATRIEKELGFESATSFAAGLQMAVRWYLENAAWWRPILDGSYRDWMKQQYGES